MFRKRAVVIDVVKKSDVLTPVEESDHANVGAHISVLMDQAVVGGLMLIGAYFAADALRAVVIHTAVTKIQPTIVVEAAKK